MNPKLKEILDQFPKPKKKLIHNEILGLTTQEKLNDAIKMGAIVVREGRYFIATELANIAQKSGRGSFVKPTIVVSRKWYEFKEKYEGIKINSYTKEKGKLF